MENENMNNPQEEKEKLKDLDEPAPGEVEVNENDEIKVKFLNGGKGASPGDPHVVVDVSSDNSYVSFTGLGKEELMKYADDPFWVRIRYILFALFWIGWLAMLVAAIVIIVLAPRCPERPDLKWYQTEVIYQIFPKSFQDTTVDKNEIGAGVGDLQGIINHVPDLEDLGVKALWINSIYQSGGLYDGNDVQDHKAIDPIFGSQDTFDTLRKITKKKVMRLILDFIPNHTGKNHSWFISSKAKEGKYDEYYIWADCKGADKRQPPNNWLNLYGKPAWTHDPTRKQCYYHKGLPDYPDLNLRNPDVQAEMNGILEHWLSKGVDGFNVVGAQYLMENENMTDEATNGEFTVDNTDNMGLIKSWREILNRYSDKPGREKVLIMNVEDLKNSTGLYYDAGINVVPSKTLTKFGSTCDAQCLSSKLANDVNVGKWLGWMLDNDETPRFGSVEKYLYKVLQTLHLLFPGTAFVYYGDEIAMKNGNISSLDVRDPVSKLYSVSTRDAYRTPMMWTIGNNFGFCADDIVPWLPVNMDGLSVQAKTAYKLGSTTPSMHDSFKDLVALRRREAFQWGTVEKQEAVHNNEIFYFTRNAKGFPSYLVAINMAAVNKEIAYSFSHLADKMTAVYHSEEGMLSGSPSVDTKSKSIGFSKRGEVYVFEY
ncbi:hypothetical protein ACJMK2_037166 [Sinanodonta woodiana]|uniref:Glycosyl hydrolase family 13 catalytic domain-containing protein n=1 Tax=Sinanodonta woodiana TaxID=1069815 RepID=A0ABD3WL91_SINWO